MLIGNNILAKTNKTIQIPVNVNLEQSTYDTISKLVGDPEQIGPAVNGLLDDFITAFADGAIVIKSGDLRRMSTAANKKIANSETIVELVEAAVHRKGSQHEYKVTLDQAHIAHLQQICSARGITIEAMVQEAFMWASQNGWIYGTPQRCTICSFSPEQHDILCKVLKKDSFTGNDIFTALKAALKGTA